MGTLKTIVKSRPVTWACRTFFGNLVLFEVLLGVPLFVTFSLMDYENNILSLDRVFFVGIVCFSGGTLLGLFMWLLVTRPAMNMMERWKSKT